MDTQAIYRCLQRSKDRVKTIRDLFEQNIPISFFEDKCLNFIIDKNDYAAIELLLEHGYTRHTTDHRVIMRAIKKDSFEIVKLLVSHGSMVCSDTSCPLMYAVVKCDPVLLSLLLTSERADVHYNNDVLLTTAVYLGRDTIVEILLKHGANPNANKGQPLYISAVKFDMYAITVLLLKYGARIGSKNTRGVSIFTKASRKGHQGAVRAFLESENAAEII